MDRFLRSVRLKREKVADFEAYPFCIPGIRALASISFHPAVTFFSGDNGTGKSTLLEAIAIAAGLNAEGGSRNFTFRTRDTHSSLHEYIQLIRGVRRPADSYFLRAESFYNLASNIDDLEVVHSYGNRSLHAQSHGESFWALLSNRFQGNGLYLLDEPEAALSPSRQLAALAVIHQLARRRAQFIIATHSPILMAYPDAVIYLFSGDEIRQVAYENTEHYQVTRDFLNHVDSSIKELLRNDEELFK